MRWFLLILSVIPIQIYCQTCCSGGVPVSKNLGLPIGEAKDLQFSIGYDLNVLKTLKSGTRVIDDDSRNRTTHSILFEFGYGLTPQFSIDALMPFVRQERTVTNANIRHFTYTQGLGDLTLLFKYNLINKPTWSFTPALGIKFPTGSSTKQTKDGIALNADLQPGSGALDGLVWFHFLHSVPSRPSSSFYGNIVYARKGHNMDYLRVQDYKFGDEWQIAVGWVDQFLIYNKLLDPGIILRYRHASRDEINDSPLPSTGGQWIFANPSITLWFNPDLSWNLNFDVPVFAKITGTQVTPTFRINTGIYFRISLIKDSIQ